MNNKAINIETYEFTNKNKLLFDTNIWFYLYAPQGKPNKQTDVYSQAFANILKARSDIFIDVLILSEFINRYARQREPAESKGFKSFRKSQEFRAIAVEIANISRRILDCSQRVSNRFDLIDAKVLLTEFENNRPDFNDQILVEICKSHDFMLVTDDADFKDCDCTILTANRKLL